MLISFQICQYFRPVFHLPQNHLHLLLLLLLLWPFILEAANPLYHIRGSNGNYTAKSTYAENLSTLLSSFSSHISSTNGFYNLSSGKAYGRVNGIGLCRGDVGPTDCHACIKNSTLEIKRQCPNQKEAVIWYDNCMLRYSNQSIFGVIDWVDEFSMWNRDNVTSVAEFNQAMKELMGALSSRAAAGNSTLKFAIGKTAGPDSMTIYGLSQCTPDLSEPECNHCLTKAINNTLCCTGQRGRRVLNPSCHVRYEVYPFYDPSTEISLVLAPAPAPAVPPPVASPPASPPFNDGGLPASPPASSPINNGGLPASPPVNSPINEGGLPGSPRVSSSTSYLMMAPGVSSARVAIALLLCVTTSVILKAL